MSVFDRTQLPHPYLPTEWGPSIRADESAKAPALPDVNPGALVVARLRSKLTDDSSGVTGGGGGSTNTGTTGSGGSPGDYPDVMPPLMTGEITIVCKQRCWTATLCGWSEFAASTPPKKFLVLDRDYAVDGYCRGDPAQSYSSAFHYIGTYTPTGAGCGTVTVTGTGGGAAGGYDPTASFCGIVTPAYTKTSTTSRADTGAADGTSPGACCGATFSNHINGGHDYVALSIEDTEEAAIERARSTLADWSTISGSDCLYAQACWEQRTTGFTVSGCDAKLFVTGNGYYSFWPYTLTIVFERRVDGSSDPWVEFATMEYTVSGDIYGNLSAVIDVPNERGYCTRRKSHTFSP